MADGKDGQELTGSLRVRILQSTSEDRFEFDINGQPIGRENVRCEPVEDNELPHVWHEIGLAKCPPFSGHNELGMTITSSVTARHAGDAGTNVYELFPYMEELIITVDPG